MLGQIRTSIELLRPLNCLMAAIGALITSLIALGGIEPLTILWRNILLGFIVVATATGGGNAINDFFDLEIDKINYPSRPLPSGRIHPETALLLGLVLFGLAIVLGAFINRLCLAIVIINMALLYYYSTKLKLRGLSGNITIGYLVGSIFLFGGAMVEKLLVASILAGCAAFATIGREIVKDIEDVVGDKEVGAKTLPITYGSSLAGKIAATSILIAIALSPLPYLWRLLSETYLFFIFIADAFFLWTALKTVLSPTRSTAFEVKKQLKLAMGIALFAFILGAIT